MQKTPEQLRNRRYYLHRRIKRFARLKVSLKTIYIGSTMMGGGNVRDSFYMNELCSKYNYVVQLEID